jgi:Flp pilus assembly pilin Flp
MLSRVREHGQGLVEYALLLFFIALVVLLVLMIFGPIIGNVFSKINTSLLSF